MTREEPEWLTLRDVRYLHDRQLLRFGGLPGERDEGAIESALARPQQKWAYEEDADLATLAAAYGFGLAKNHGFSDGNKRVAYAALTTFLAINGLRFTASEADATVTMLAVAAGDKAEAELAAWCRVNSEPRE